MLTVSIVTYNTDLAELRRCLQSLDFSVVERVYIVDNSRREYIRDFAREEGYEYIPLPNPGFGAAHNEAIRRAIELGATYHLVLNSDITFHPSVLRKAIDYMENNERVGALHPLVYYPDGRRQFTARMLPTPLDVFGRRFLPKRWIAGRDRRYTLQDLDISCEQDVPYFQGSFMFLRIEALKKTGLFDERFFMYPEDIDLVRRIHARYRTVLWPEISIVHDHRAASYHSLRMTWIHALNMCRYFAKWGWFFDSPRRRINRELRSRL